MQDQQKQRPQHERNDDAGSCSEKGGARGTAGDAVASNSRTGRFRPTPDIGQIFLFCGVVVGSSMKVC